MQVTQCQPQQSEICVKFSVCHPRGPGEASSCREANIAARQLLPLNCLAVTLPTEAILKEERMSSRVGERPFGRHFKRQFGRGQSRVKNCRETVGSQFLPRDIQMSRTALWDTVFGKRAWRYDQGVTNVHLSNVHFVRAHLKGGNGKGGYSHLLASALSLRAVGLATVLSHKCAIRSLLKDDQIARNNRLPVQCQHLALRRHRTVLPVATQMSLPPVLLPVYPLFRRAQFVLRDLSALLDPSWGS